MRRRARISASGSPSTRMKSALAERIILERVVDGSLPDYAAAAFAMAFTTRAMFSSVGFPLGASMR